MNDLISIIVPVYNVEKYLDECIHSLVEQTYTNLEIILVDDGSPDNCPAMCDAWAEKDRRIRVIHQKNGGISTARNAALEVATGEYLCFADSDDYLERTMIEKLYYKLNDGHADIAVCGYYDLYGQKVTSHYAAGDDLFFDDDQKFVSLYEESHVVVWNKLFAASLFEDLRFEDIYCGEDAFLMVQLFDRAQRIVFLSEPLYYYRYREDSIIHLPITARKFDACLAREKSLNFYAARNLTKAYSKCLFVYFYMLSDLLRSAQIVGIDADGELLEKYETRLLILYQQLMCTDIPLTQKLKIFMKQRLPRIYYTLKR